MKVGYKQLKKWILHPVSLIGVAAIAIACQLESLAVSSPANPVPTSTVLSFESSTSTLPKNQAVYRNNRFRFQFSYSPKDFVVDVTPTTPSRDRNSPLVAIDIWTQKHGQAIRAGTYRNGTELPANVAVAVFRNSPLPLRKWVQQSNQFVMTRDFKDTKVAGQKAIAFQSSGLYENEHFAFTNPNSSNIIVISFSKINYGDNDAIYRRAFKQAVDSFAFLNQ